MESGAAFIILISFGLALVVPFIILGIFLHRVRVLKQSWKLILVKAVCAAIAWASLSFLMLNVAFFFVYTSAHTPRGASAGIGPLLKLLTITVVYGLAGWGLCHWVASVRHSAIFDLGLNRN